MNIRTVAAIVAAAGILVGSAIIVERTIVPDSQESTALANAADQQRKEDLYKIALRLQLYRVAYGIYPTSGSPEHGKGSRPMNRVLMGELLDSTGKMFNDPAGESYWYESNGQYFVLYARRSGDKVHSCKEQPKHPVPQWDS